MEEGAATAATGAAAEPEYPVRLDIDRQEEYSRFMPLIKWLLALPHLFALIFLGLGALFAIFASWFAVLVTGRYPRGLFDYVVGVQRWGQRVAGYILLMTDRYPPFSLADDPDFPVRFNIDYPEDGVSRWRPLVAWLLAIPFLVVAGVIYYLAEVVIFLAFFAILFTKKFPEGMFKIVLVSLRWQARGNAYAMWMVTKYPPFVWE